MTVRRSDLPQIGLEARHVGELLITPCPCKQTDYKHLTAHTLGEHLWAATRDMQPGPKAQAFEPSTIPPSTSRDPDHEPPAPVDLHARYNELTNNLWTGLRALQTFIDSYRPDRNMPTGPTFTDDEWCTHHLETIGVCEPRYRGDLCRRCYGVHLTTGTRPPEPVLKAWRVGARITDADLTAAIAAEKAAAKQTRKPKRKKAS